jgi:hypothetical protein
MASLWGANVAPCRHTGQLFLFCGQTVLPTGVIMGNGYESVLLMVCAEVSRKQILT